MSKSPEYYNCSRCIASKHQNRVRGRECLLDRDYRTDPIEYRVKFRNHPEIGGVVHSEAELYDAIEKIQKLYTTSDVGVALRRIGLGICPKSFPTSPQSLYFLGLYNRTHGGETGNQLVNLPMSGGTEEQPSVFYEASNIISEERTAYLNKELKDISAGHNEVPEPSNPGIGSQRT